MKPGAIVRKANATHSPREMEARVELAACYRLVSLYGMTDLIYNHISARVPDREGHLMINSYGMMYDEVTASSLVTIDLDGNVVHPGSVAGTVNKAGVVIHTAIHGARPDVGCVLHTHTRAGMAVSAMKCGLLPLASCSTRFYDAIGYHDYHGPVTDPTEQVQLLGALGSHNALILRNHGLLVCGRTVPEAFLLMYFLESACRLQVDVMAAGTGVSIPSRKALQRAARLVQPKYADRKQAEANFRQDGQVEWRALLRQVKRIDATYSN